MKLTIFQIPRHNITIQEHRLAFYHPLDGAEMFWIVPMLYVIKLKFKGEHVEVSLSEAYFEQSTNQLAA